MATWLFMSALLAALAALGLATPDVSQAQDVERLLVRRLFAAAVFLGTSTPCRFLENWPAWQSLAGWVRHELAAKGHELGRFETTGLMVMAWGIVSAGIGAMVGSLGAGAAVFGAAFGLVPLAADTLERQRKEAIAKAMPDLLRSLASSLGAGQTLSQSIGYVGVHTKGEAGAAFRRAGLQVRCGMAVSEALHDLEKSLDAPGVSLLSCALVVSQRTGAPLEGLLNRSADLVEEQAALKASLGTKTAQVRLSARVVMVLPALLVAALAAMAPDYREGLITPVGIACLALAIFLDGVALVIMRRIVAQVAP